MNMSRGKTAERITWKSTTWDNRCTSGTNLQIITIARRTESAKAYARKTERGEHRETFRRIEMHTQKKLRHIFYYESQYRSTVDCSFCCSSISQCICLFSQIENDENTTFCLFFIRLRKKN